MNKVWIVAVLACLSLVSAPPPTFSQPNPSPSPPPPIFDGNPVGPFHYNGKVYSQAQSSTAAACLTTGTCQIDAVVSVGSASPAPTCPPSQQCFAFNSSSMTDLTYNESHVPMSGIIVVSSSVLPRLTVPTGGAYASSYVKGPAATVWQHAFAACGLGSGQCQIDLYIATTFPATSITTAAVVGCSPSAQECLSFNGNPMQSVNDNETVGAAITIVMQSP